MSELDRLRGELEAKLASCTNLEMFATLCYTYWDKAHDIMAEIDRDIDINL